VPRTYRELLELDRLDVDAMRTLHALELSGGPYYEALAARVAAPAVAALLRRNGREEGGHARRLGRAIAHLTGEPFVAPEDAPAPVRLADDVVVDAAMLERLRQSELDGDRTYRHWAEHEPDPVVATALARNGREEALHGRRLLQAIALLPTG
jgi:hypothetical protein